MRSQERTKEDKREIRPTDLDKRDARPTLSDKRDARPTGFFNPMAPVEISRRHLPHWAQDGAIYFVTFRLADSIPTEKLAVWRAERERWFRNRPEPLSPGDVAEYHERFTRRIEEWLDAGAGSCLLGFPENSAVVAAALRYFDGDRYVLHEWVVMPNHVHVLFRIADGWRPGEVLHSWKSYTAKEINRCAGRAGQIWQHDSYDHIVRNESVLFKVSEYIRRNPETAKVEVHHASWL